MLHYRCWAIKRRDVLGRPIRLLFFRSNVTGASRENNLVCVHSELDKAIQFERLQHWCYWSDWLIKCTVEMAPKSMTFRPNLLKIYLGLRVILMLLPRHSDSLLCWYYKWEAFMIYVIEMTSNGMIYIPSVMKIYLGIPVILRLLPQHSDSLPWWYYKWEVFMMYVVEITTDDMI
jgi:hypothetical protein